MGRTKQTVPKRKTPGPVDEDSPLPGGVMPMDEDKVENGATTTTANKTPIKRVAGKRARKVPGAPRKKRRYRNGTLALREIRKYQKSTELLLRKAPFHRLVREIGDDNHSDLRWKGSALAALQTGAEDFLTELFGDCNQVAINDRRVTVFAKDMKLATRLRRDGGTNASSTMAVAVTAAPMAPRVLNTQ